MANTTKKTTDKIQKYEKILETNKSNFISKAVFQKIIINAIKRNITPVLTII